MSPALWSFIEQRLFPPTHLSTDWTGQNCCDTLEMCQPQIHPGGQRMTPREARKMLHVLANCVVLGKLQYSPCLFLSSPPLFHKQKTLSLIETCSIDNDIWFPLLRQLDRKEVMPQNVFLLSVSLPFALLWLCPFADSCDFSECFHCMTVLTINWLFIIGYLCAPYPSVSDMVLLYWWQSCFTMFPIS